MTGTLLTTVEVAERLGLSSAAVAQAVRTGALQPAARTNDDFLFTERTIAAYAERRAQAVTSPLPPPAGGTRSEWWGDVGRLNSWLSELTEALPRTADPVEPPPIAEPEPVAVKSEPEPVAAESEPEPPAPEPPAPDPPTPAPVAAKSILERIAASELAVSPATATAPQKEAKPPEPEREPVDWPDLEPEPAPEPVAATSGPEPSPDPAALPAGLAKALTAPVPEVSGQGAAPSSDLSRQAILVVQPVVRFRVLRDVADRLTAVPGVSDARLERLEGGVASYRVSFHGDRPSPEAMGGPLADLNLEVMLVESSL